MSNIRVTIDKQSVVSKHISNFKFLKFGSIFYALALNSFRYQSRTIWGMLYSKLCETVLMYKKDTVKLRNIWANYS